MRPQQTPNHKLLMRSRILDCTFSPFQYLFTFYGAWAALCLVHITVHKTCKGQGMFFFPVGLLFLFASKGVCGGFWASFELLLFLVYAKPLWELNREGDDWKNSFPLDCT